jgi:hypothetical protein
MKEIGVLGGLCKCLMWAYPCHLIGAGNDGIG